MLAIRGTQGEKPMEITLRSFFHEISASIEALFAAKYAPDDVHEDALGEQVELLEEFMKSGYRLDE